MGVKIRERFPGQWWVYINHKNNRTAKPAGDLETATEAKRIIEQQLALGMFQFPKREPPKPKEAPAITVKEYYETFKRVWLNSACRESTQQGYKGAFDHYILPRFGERALNAVNRKEVKELVADLVAKKLARATIRVIVSNFCTMFSHAIEDEIISANPATRMPKYFRQAHILHEEIQPLTAAEVPVFLAAAITHDQNKRYKDVPEYYPLFLCAIHTGMRAGELAGLQWQDIDWNGKFIWVRRAIKSGKVQPTKTGKKHKIDMSDALIEELQAMRRRRLAEFLKNGKNAIPEWVFCNSDGNPLDIQNVKNRHFNKCLEAAKLRRIRFHDLRHTFASLLLQNGESPQYVKEQMGHSSIKITVDVYGHMIPGANRQAMNRLPSSKSATQPQQDEKEKKEAV
jgi:integrase